MHPDLRALLTARLQQLETDAGLDGACVRLFIVGPNYGMAEFYGRRAARAALEAIALREALDAVDVIDQAIENAIAKWRVERGLKATLSPAAQLAGLRRLGAWLASHVPPGELLPVDTKQPCNETRAVCLAKSPDGYVCSRWKGHQGDHSGAAATTLGTMVLSTWPSTPDASRPEANEWDCGDACRTPDTCNVARRCLSWTGPRS